MDVFVQAALIAMANGIHDCFLHGQMDTEGVLVAPAGLFQLLKEGMRESSAVVRLARNPIVVFPIVSLVSHDIQNSRIPGKSMKGQSHVAASARCSVCGGLGRTDTSSSLTIR